MSTSNVSVTFDVKWSRFRIPKKILYALGYPKYIQFLINIDKQCFAILAVDSENSISQPHRVRADRLCSEKSTYDIYSTSFLNLFSQHAKDMDRNCSYRFMGKIFEDRKAAVFSFGTMVNASN